MSHEVEDDVHGRLVKLETEVTQIRVELSEVKADIKELRKEVRNEITSLKDSLSARMETLHVDIVMTKAWTLGMLAAILGVMAHGFHWL